MKATRENILRILREHPGLRKREIASYLNCHHFTIITTLHEMEEDVWCGRSTTTTPRRWSSMTDTSSQMKAHNF